MGLLVAPEEPLLPLAGSAPPPVPPLAPELASGGEDVEEVPSAELPPELELSPAVPAACSLELELSSPAPAAELEAVVEVEVVEVVVVEVPCVASLSAWVLLGGVISGVL